ncbi:cache domain-containing sensor histidine kinase [Paenibacillus sp. CAU 1782]
MGKSFYHWSLKTKLILIIQFITTLVAVTLGYYSFETSKTQIVNKVSVSNQSVITVIDNNITRMQRSISDWATVFILSSTVQQGLQETATGQNVLESALYSGPAASLMDQMLVTGNFDYLALYGENSSDPLYQVATDDSSGPAKQEAITGSEVYRQTELLNGAPHWFPLTQENNAFIEYNRQGKMGMSRIVRSTLNGEKLGFIFVGVNHQTIRNHYLKNLYDQDHGILILDQNGESLLTAGKAFYESNLDFFGPQDGDLEKTAGSRVTQIGGEELLLSYSVMNNGWRIYYAVPLDLLTKELNAIKLFVMLAILAIIVLTIPLTTLLTSFLTAPIKKLLISMRRFQNGHFGERVEVKYQDEIGLLSQGYNNMVLNIKTLVDEAYVLRLKEKEAELKALQSQINPHFLYNMLDMIFWEAEKAGQDRISEMVITLSRLFRLSLNRGKSFTSLGKEKDLILQYLKLQQMRFADKLTCKIDIPEELEQYVILKLLLQPFIENALIHGIERKREGGYVHVSASLNGGHLSFVIEDNGVGMDEDMIKKITELQPDSDVYTAQETGGYAIQNVIQRLRHYYKDEYRLTYVSELGKGTRVELDIPAMTENREEEEHG